MDTTAPKDSGCKGQKSKGTKIVETLFLVATWIALVSKIFRYHQNKRKSIEFGLLDRANKVRLASRLPKFTNLFEKKETTLFI